MKAFIASLAIVGVVLGGVGTQVAQAAFDPPAGQVANEHRTPRFKGVGLQIVMDTLDVNKGQVISTLAKGETLADLAEANGSTGDALVEALMAPVEERVAQALEDGKITDDRAGEILAKAEERISDFVFSTHKPTEHPRFAKQRGRFVHIAADTLGMTPEELRSELQTGATLAELGDEAGVTVDDLADALIAPVEPWVQTQVDAGRVDADQAADRLAELRERIVDRING